MRVQRTRARWRIRPPTPALVQEQLNEAVYEWLGVSPAEWQRGADWSDRERTVINWDGLLIDGWQPIDGTTPRLPLPEDCRP